MDKLLLFIFSLLKYILFGFMFAILFADYVGQANKVSGQSMSPTMADGDYLIVNKLLKDYALDDIVVIEVNEKKIVKRIVAEAGDAVEVKDGQLYVNDIRVTYTLNEEPFAEDFPRTLVEKGKVFVIGDNYNHSSDSRHFGTFYYSQIEGEVMYVISLEQLRLKKLTK